MGGLYLPPPLPPELYRKARRMKYEGTGKDPVQADPPPRSYLLALAVIALCVAGSYGLFMLTTI